MELLNYEYNASFDGNPLYHLISYAGCDSISPLVEFEESLYQDGESPYVISDNHQHNLIFNYGNY